MCEGVSSDKSGRGDEEKGKERKGGRRRLNNLPGLISGCSSRAWRRVWQDRRQMYSSESKLLGYVATTDTSTLAVSKMNTFTFDEESFDVLLKCLQKITGLSAWNSWLLTALPVLARSGIQSKLNLNSERRSFQHRSRLAFGKSSS